MCVINWRGLMVPERNANHRSSLILCSGTWLIDMGLSADIFPVILRVYVSNHMKEN